MLLIQHPGEALNTIAWFAWPLALYYEKSEIEATPLASVLECKDTVESQPGAEPLLTCSQHKSKNEMFTDTRRSCGFGYSAKLTDIRAFAIAVQPAWNECLSHTSSHGWLCLSFYSI